jgi:SAM-dependent methyltransferase
MATIANTDMAAAWDGDEGAGWAANADHYERAGQRIWAQFRERVPVGQSDRVLDIGCGTGKSTRAMAQAARNGSALGIDLSSKMLALARTRAEQEGISNIRFEHGDAQVHAFPARAFDLAISSFGCMFFADPVAAYGNIATALRSGGRLALLAWRDLPSNEWITALLESLSLGRELFTPPPGAPGPFAFADQDHVRRILVDAGYRDVQLDPIDAPQELGLDTADALAFVQTTGITKGMLEGLDEPSRQRAVDNAREVLAAHETPEGVLLGAAAWLITAQTP